MENLKFKIGQTVVFNYDRNYMTTEKTRKHDGEIVTIIREQYEAQGKTYLVVENQYNGIYPVMIQELSTI
jgi:hypothetical protein